MNPDLHTDTDFERRFGGLRRLYGEEGAQRIFQSHAVVVGIGGVGSWAAEALARSGVRALTLVDLDHLSPSNTNRQIHALTDTFGQSKVEAMKARIVQINPGCQVQAIDDFVTPDNWPQLLGDAAHVQRLYVLDACDQLSAKTAMARWALQTRQPFITVGAAGGKSGAHHIEIGDLHQTSHDPVLARLRQRLRKEGAAPRTGPMGVVCVYSREPMTQPAICAPDERVDANLNCHGYGSSVAVTATFGFCAAGHLLTLMATSDSGQEKREPSAAPYQKSPKETL